MKKTTILLFALFNVFYFSQETITLKSGQKVVINENKTWDYVNESSKNTSKLTENDVKEIGGNITTDVLEPPIKLYKNGNDDLTKVKVSFHAPVDKYKLTDFERINLMYEISISWTKNKLKNPYSFIPKEIDLFYNKDYSLWSCIVKYIAKNSYGGEVDSSSFFMYPMEKVYRPYTDDEMLELTKKNKRHK